MPNKALIAAAAKDKLKDKTPVAVPKLAPEITEQSDYIRSYINSPKYKERLIKQINTEEKLQPYMLGKFANNELFKGMPLDQNRNTMAAILVKRLNDNLDEGVANTSKDDHYLGKYVAGGYDSAHNDVRFNQELIKQNPTVPVHEYSHAALDGAIPYSDNFKSQYVDKVFKKTGSPGWEPEVQKPAELKARLDAIRYLLKKNGIYDAGTETFNKEHLDKMRSDKTITNDFNFKQLESQLDDKYKNNGMIWLFNNIAKTKNNSGNGTENA